MRIAIIDCGIIKSSLKRIKIKKELLIKENGIIYNGNDADIISTHGTYCAKIFEENLCTSLMSEVELYSINIFTRRDGKSNVLQLKRALEWCYQHNISIINLSIGSTNLTDFCIIRSCIARLILNGQVVVAAESNSGTFSAPALLRECLV